jgi:hypothetical protein
MATIQFFNFGNGPTYHYFAWLRESGLVDVKDIVRTACAAVEGDRWDGIGECPSIVARDKLATMLRGILEEKLGEALPGCASVTEPPRIGDVDASLQSLFRPFVREAAGRIDFDKVAVALLIDAGKWDPDPMPEYFLQQDEKRDSNV